MTRTTVNESTYDNILDSSSYFAVELPVTIIVSNINILIEMEEHLGDVFEDLIDDENFFGFYFCENNYMYWQYRISR